MVTLQSITLVATENLKFFAITFIFCNFSFHCDLLICSTHLTSKAGSKYAKIFFKSFIHQFAMKSNVALNKKQA